MGRLLSLGWCAAVTACTAMAVFVVLRAKAQVPIPNLSIGLASSNQFQIQITNGVGYANYEIYRQWELDPNAQWILHMIGAQGQTNFSTNMGIFTMGFFRAAVGSDWDGDGIPNWLDAQPSSTNAGALTITIDSPTNNATIQ
jgi:hypothetical protein